MNQKQFEILAGKMRAGDLRDAVRSVMVFGAQQSYAARTYGVSKQSLNQAIKRLNKRAVEFAAMGKLKL